MGPLEAEFIATAVLILMGGGVVANVLLEGTNGNKGGWIVITTAWALAVFIGVVISGPYSGAHLNPAVSVGLAIAGKFPWEDVLPYSIAQLLGAMTGAFFVWLIYRDHFEKTEDKGNKRAVFCTSPAIRNYPINFLNEAMGTFVLIFCVLHFTDGEIGSTKEVIGLGSLGAIPVSFVVWAIGLSLGGVTGYAINPVRDLGPRIMHAILPISNKADNDWSYAWVPILGPIAGAVFAALLANVLHS